jgi:hypothetical protein
VDLRNEEVLARYLYSKNHFRSDNTVKHHAFMPPVDKRLSIFRTYGLVEEEIWALGATLRAEALVARADTTVLNVKDAGLTVEPDEPPERHACIVGWPPDQSAILEKALRLSQKAVLRRLRLST